MYLPQLLDKGITTVSDVIDSDGAVLKMDELKQIYSIHHLNLLHYLRVQQNIKSLFKKTKLCTFSSAERPFVPFHLKKIFINKKDTSVFYKISSKQRKNQHSMKFKWHNDLQIYFDDKIWTNIFKICFTSVTSNDLIWFQVKVIYRLLGTKSYLHKLGIMEDSFCSQCGERETLTHLFVDCYSVKEKWKIVENYVYNSINLKIVLERSEILLGYQFQNQNRVPINALLLVTKNIYSI